ncbi:MAG: biotin/lipoyl-containing protein [Bacteroidota bacterium]
MKLKITVDGKLYEVEVEVSDPKLEGPTYVPPLHAKMPGSSPPAGVPRKAPPAATTEVADESKVCRSPLAGTVARINAEVGKAIEENDVLMVLEAMKMETEITAPFAGTVKAIPVEVGSAVKQGQVLVEIE